MSSPVLQVKRGLLANLPGLRSGEPGFTTDSYDLYVGLTSETSTNKFLGSHRYWTKNTATKGSGVNLVEGTDNGTSFLTLKSPDSLSGIGTYVFPDTTDGTAGDFLKLTSYTGGVYSLEWASVPSGSFTLAADSGSNDTFTTGETLTFEGGEGVDTTVSDNKITIAAEIASDTNAGVASFTSADFSVGTGGLVSIQEERIQDIVGSMVSSNTETLITVTYQDSDGTIDFVVDNDLANYSNTNSAFITASSTDTLTNKTFDANGTGNSLSNVEVADFASSAITDSTDTIASNDSDTQIPTSAAVIDYVATEIGNIDLTVSTAGDSGTGSVSTSQTLTISGTSDEIETSASGQTITIGLPNNVVVGGGLTATTFTLAGVAVTAILDEDTMVSNRANALATQQSIKAYVDTTVGNIDLTVSTAGDSGTGSVSTSQTLTISGTANEVNTSASGQTITIGLPDSVTVTTALTTPTVNATNLKANDGTSAITITDSTGAVATAGNLTVGGDLIVNGSTTQVNTTSLTIEDTLIELARVDNADPSSDVNKDIGILLNYYTDSAKKAAVYWDDSSSRIAIASDVSESSSVLTANAYAALEIGGLWVNDCAGQSQVISCTGSTRNLENITIDGGTF